MQEAAKIAVNTAGALVHCMQLVESSPAGVVLAATAEQLNIPEIAEELEHKAYALAAEFGVQRQCSDTHIARLRKLSVQEPSAQDIKNMPRHARKEERELARTVTASGLIKAALEACDKMLPASESNPQMAQFLHTNPKATARDYIRRCLAQENARWRTFTPFQYMPLGKASPDAHQVAEAAVRKCKAAIQDYVKRMSMLDGDSVPVIVGPYQVALLNAFNHATAQAGQTWISMHNAITKMICCLRILAADLGDEVVVQFDFSGKGEHASHPYTVLGTAGRWIRGRWG